MRQQRRDADEDSISKQEQMKRQTLEYEYQLKASVKQQKINQELEAQRLLQDENRTFVSGMFA